MLKKKSWSFHVEITLLIGHLNLNKKLVDDSGHVVAEPSREHDNPAYMYFQHYVEFPTNGYLFKISSCLQNS